MQRLTPDICVIGGGAAGLSVAAAAAAFHVPTVLIERGRMGGECLHTGCVPSKALLAAARRVAEIREAEDFGIHTAELRVDFSKIMAHVRATIARIAPNDSAERFSGLGVRVIAGEARFKDRRSVIVGDEFEIRPRRFVIATGSMPAIPAIQGLAEGTYFTNETIFELTELPTHLIVIGAGAVGLELAQAFRQLGSEVTVLEAGEALAQDDPECAEVVLAQIEREGVTMRTGVTITRVTHALGQVSVAITHGGKEETIGGSHLLVAAGRKPVVDPLDLKAAGIRHNDDGILVNRRLKTSNSRAYAVGDVAAGLPRFTHAASYQASLVIRNALFRAPVRVDTDSIPHVIYTDPELAQTGLMEAQARQRGLKIRVLRWPYHDNDRAQIERKARGHIKVIADGKDRILGASIAGPQAGELITAWTLAIAQRLTVRTFAELVVPYPTLSEIGKRAALDLYLPRLTQPLLRRIISMMRSFG